MRYVCSILAHRDSVSVSYCGSCIIEQYLRDVFWICIDVVFATCTLWSVKVAACRFLSISELLPHFQYITQKYYHVVILNVVAKKGMLKLENNTE